MSGCRPIDTVSQPDLLCIAAAPVLGASARELLGDLGAVGLPVKDLFKN
jgi:hypothetical protein